VWVVYIVKCSDGSFYTGITTDITRRVKEHNGSKRGAKYTRSRRPVALIAKCLVKDRSSALRLESKIKSLKREKKVAYLLKETSNELENYRDN
jgi:putative endonuclease